jgi:tripartite-type tricarboxylate transporter receptor subunit TctC
MKKKSSLVLGLLALLIVGSPSAQTTYPEKPIRLVIGFPPGSQPDTVARLLGQKLTEALGKQVVIDNIAGAAGNIAADRVARAAPDGYTLGLLGQGTVVINPSLYKVAFDPMKDFVPVSQFTVSPYLLVVHNAVPAKSVKELLALAKAQPGGLMFGSAGSVPHVTAELFKSVAGVDIRLIPYKGGAEAIRDLLGGRVTMMFASVVGGLPLAREGRLRALAVTTLRRFPAVPELPTIAESGYPGFEVASWSGVLAPTGTPSTIIGRLHLETVKALAMPDLRAKLSDLGLEGMGSSPDEFAAAIKSEIPKWAKVIKDAGIKLD